MRVKLFIIFLLIKQVLLPLSFDIGGIRNMSMGGVGIASSIDNSSAIYNPSLLYNLRNIQLSSDYGKLYWHLANDNISNGFIAISFPIKKIGSFAFTSTFFNSMDFNKNKFGFHFGRNIFTKNFSLGFSFIDYINSYSKNQYTDYDPLFINNSFSKNYYNFETGAYLKLSKNFNIACVFRNLLDTDISLENDNSDKMPKSIGIGINYNISKLIIALDTEYIFKNISNNELFKKNLGLEYHLNKKLDLRMGINNNSFTSGFGINIFHKTNSQIIHDPLNSEEIVNTTFINIKINYAFLYPLNSIISDYGDHFIGITLDYSNSTIPKDKLQNFIPPKIKKVYYKRTFVDSFKSQNVNTDTFLIKQKIKIDTVYIEKIKFDTLKIYSGISDSLYRKKVAELERTKLKLENVKRINKALIHLSNAMKYYYSSDYSNALKECKKALNLAPDLSLGYIRIGSIYYRIGDYQKAKKYWKKAKRIDPNNPELKEIPKGFL